MHVVVEILLYLFAKHYDWCQEPDLSADTSFRTIQTDNRTYTTSIKTGYRILSGFARVNYDYNYRYMVSVVARYDGISKLSDNRWGFFPGISAGWNVHEEAFFKDSKFAEVVRL